MNFHTLAFHLAERQVIGPFEHHTDEPTKAGVERYLRQLGDGTISNAEVIADMGHGALVRERPVKPLDLLAVTVPRHGLLDSSALDPCPAVPHGAMMVAGCFGLLRATTKRLPNLVDSSEPLIARFP